MLLYQAIKCPDMFRAADLMLLNKIDLLAHFDYDVAAALRFARWVNPARRIIQLAATSGEGMDEWLTFLRDGVAQASAAKHQTPTGRQHWPCWRNASASPASCRGSVSGLFLKSLAQQALQPAIYKRR